MNKNILLTFICALLFNITQNKNSIPFTASVKLGCKKLLLQHLPNEKGFIDQQDEFGNTALHYAVHLQHKSITDLLLMHFANPTIKNKKGKTPLDIAHEAGNKYIIRRLQLYSPILLQNSSELKNGQILNKQYIRYAKSGNLKELKRTSNYPAVDKNIPWGKFKRTALIYATRNNRKEVVDYLINQLKVDHSIKDTYGWTAYDYAKKQKNVAIINLLPSNNNAIH